MVSLHPLVGHPFSRWSQRIAQGLLDPALVYAGRRRRAAFRVYLFNLVLGCAFGLAYISDHWDFQSVRASLFAVFGLVSTIATVALVPFAITLLGAHSRFSDSTLGIASAVLWSLSHLVLIIDAHVYRLFGYHLGSSTLNLFLTPGSEDSFRVGPAIYLRSLIIAVLLFFVEWTTWRMARSSADAVRDLVAELRARWRSAAMGCVVLGAIFVDKGLYASAELERDAEVAAVSRALPLYPRFSITPLLPEEFGASAAQLPSVAIDHPGRALDYPRARPAPEPGAARPDILVMVIDSWRSDAFDAVHTPGIWKWAEGARHFQNHVSGGNATRFGIFSLLYGLHGSYWWPVLEQGVPPALIETLRQEGYRFGVFSSASLSFPEFDRTAFRSIPDAVHDDFEGARQRDRDRAAVQACVDWWDRLDAESDQAPRFTFLLIDSAHQPYDFPEEHAPFRPYARLFDYAELGSSLEPKMALEVKNRYFNALHFADQLGQQVLSRLQTGPRQARTVSLVTGDHGEEFAENGYWGHTGNFSPEQVAVPFVLSGPGIPAGVETRPTSHVDFAPSVLSWLGCSKQRFADYSNGIDLLDPPLERARTIAAWDELGLWTEQGIVRIPRKPGLSNQVAIWTREWRVATAQRLRLAIVSEDLQRLERDCAQFFAPAAMHK